MIGDSIVKYIQASTQELKKVSWPSRKDIFRYLVTVIFSLIFASGFIALVDFGFSRLIRLIFIS